MKTPHEILYQLDWAYPFVPNLEDYLGLAPEIVLEEFYTLISRIDEIHKAQVEEAREEVIPDDRYDEGWQAGREDTVDEVEKFLRDL